MDDLRSEAARRQRERPEDAPTQQPMRQATKPIERRKPTGDQKKVRREMARKTADLRKGAPFAGYKDFDACVAANADKDDPSGYCGYIKHKVEDGKKKKGSLVTAGNTCEQCDGTGSYPQGSPVTTGVSEKTCPFCSGTGKKESSKTARLPGVETSGDRECQACGSVGTPASTGDNLACAKCGSPSLRDAPHQYPAQATLAAQHEATKFEQAVARSDGRILINPGDQIRMPTGQTVKVNQVRRHETSRDHYYVDTDAGTTVVPWHTQFEVVPSNTSQQSIPGLGTPGGNFAQMPGHPGGGLAQDPNQSGKPVSNEAPDACPVCGTQGSLSRRGDKYQCSKCGYMDTFGGAGGQSFSDATQQLLSVRHDIRSVIARRAAEVAATDKENTL